MRVWKQLLIGLGVISAGVLLWGRFAPGANGVLTAAGLPAPLVAAIAPASDEKADGGNQGGGRRGGFGGGPTLVATKLVAMATVNDRLNAIGDGEAIRTVTVTPYATGNLTEVLVESGTRVEQGAVIGTMSHELRTPLNAIINGIQLLDMDAATSAQRSSFAMVARQARALRHRIDDVLDVASIEGGTLRLRPQPCSLASALDAMQESCAPAAAEKGVLLTVEDCDPAVWMLVDAGRVEQVISNLVCNGIKFSPVGGETRVSIDASRIGEQWQVRVTVSDSGCGIDESDQEAIFSPFVQVSEGDARCEQGVGLGLYIVRLISDAMGATIEVGRSTWGGASFQWCFTAPAVIGEAASPSLEAVFKAHAASVRSLHCLLFEDVETNRQVVERLMECAGHRLSCRHDGRDAQAAVASLAPDVVLLDLHMPGCSGWDVLEAVGSRTDGPPILVMSADTRLQVIERARSMGAAGFLCKPLDVHEVLRMLHEVAPRGSSL